MSRNAVRNALWWLLAAICLAGAVFCFMQAIAVTYHGSFEKSLVSGHPQLTEAEGTELSWLVAAFVLAILAVFIFSRARKRIRADIRRARAVATNGSRNGMIPGRYAAAVRVDVPIRVFRDRRQLPPPEFDPS